MMMLRSVHAENFPLRQLNEGFGPNSADLLIILKRHRVPLIEEWHHEDLQRLGVEGESFEIERGGELCLEQFEVVDSSVWVAPDVDGDFLASSGGVNHEDARNPDAIWVVRSFRGASRRTECQPRVF